MEITKVIVKIGETHNLGNYSSTRPEITAEATLAQGDDFGAAVDILREQINAKLYAHIDERLMQHGQSPHYYDGAKFDIYISQRLKLIAIIPHKTKPPVMELKGSSLGHTYSDWSREQSGWPWEKCTEKANQKVSLQDDDHRDSLPDTSWLMMLCSTIPNEFVYVEDLIDAPSANDIKGFDLGEFNNRVVAWNAKTEREHQEREAARLAASQEREAARLAAIEEREANRLDAYDDPGPFDDEDDEDDE